MENNLKILFFGTPEFAMPVLETLVKNGYNVSHFQSKSLKNEQTFKAFKLLNPDLCVVAAYGKILPSRYLEVPKYRGPSPIQTAILNGDKKTGVSIMVVDEEVDHGPILAQREFLISNFQFSNHDELAKKLFELGAKLLIETLPKYIRGEIRSVKQDHGQATFTKMFSREDGRINWSESCDKIYNQIKALNPEPGTWTTWKGKILNIHDGIPSLGPPLSIFNVVTKIDGNIAVATKKCYLILKSIQLEGKRETNAKSFVNGHPDFIGSVLE